MKKIKQGAWRGLLVSICLSGALFPLLNHPADAGAQRSATLAPVVVFWSDGFPFAEVEPLPRERLLQAFRGVSVRWAANETELQRALQDKRSRLFILPYGSAFPLAAWDALQEYLDRGGNLLVLGGRPFHLPVTRSGSTWQAGRLQPTWANQLLIGPAEPLAMATGWQVQPANGWHHKLPRPGCTFALTVRFGLRRQVANEEGSQDECRSLLRPLLHVLDNRGIARGCPLQEIERLEAPPGGGRWLFLTSDLMPSAAVLKRLVRRAMAGVHHLQLQVDPACIRTAAEPRPRVSWQAQGRGYSGPWTLRWFAPDGRLLWRFSGNSRSGTMSLPPRSLAPGLHRLEWRWADSGQGPREVAGGFWVSAANLLHAGSPLRVSRDWLRLDNRVLPIVGTTYMDGRVHRDFLFTPDPLRWYRDFGAMKTAGINLVRTGLWSGHERLLTGGPAAEERFLRALEAYVLSAAAHGIHVCFTFFAFLPPAPAGVNPYLDPAAVAAQKRFISNVVKRFYNVPWMHYDLINEPNYCSHGQLWSHRPFADDLEKQAWQQWLGQWLSPDGQQVASMLGALQPGQLPGDIDFSAAAIVQDRQPRKALAFYRFSNELVSNWVRGMREAVQAIAPQALVTVGQDEGGAGTRPCTLLHGRELDYSCTHSWWFNDDLLWDGLLAKLDGKPALVGETGMMRLENMDGWPRRSPEQAAALLERKMAFAWMGRQAGVVQWCWQINPYMALDNEAVIGIWRPDGTAKPEYDVLCAFARFAARAAPGLDDYVPPAVAVLVGHGRLWAGRPRAMESSQRLVRLLAERFGVIPLAISDQDPHIPAGVKWLIVPSPEFLEEICWRNLADHVQSGGRVLIMGPVGDCDWFGRPVRLPLAWTTGQRPLALNEDTPWGRVTFSNSLGEWLGAGLQPRCSAGPWWNEPIPLELGREAEPLLRLLAGFLGSAVEPPLSADGAMAHARLQLGAYLLEVWVNETAKPLPLADGSVLPAGRVSLRLVERDSGLVRATYEGPDLADK